jgi:DNA/RNA-binding domain of Phe-tRNA-synthetase-like protein
MLEMSDAWKAAFPGAHIGVLAMYDVSNPVSCEALEHEKRRLEEDLRTLFAETSIKSHEIMQAYQKYYKKFKKTYHVLHQVESIVKGKALPAGASLVEAMFIAELGSMLLTAGHDLDCIREPLKIDVSREGDKYVRINGAEQLLKPGDMVIRDREGIISSIVYGPDQRTRMLKDTRNVLFTVYGVPGISRPSMERHLQGMEANVKLIAPRAETRRMKVYAAE